MPSLVAEYVVHMWDDGTITHSAFNAPESPAEASKPVGAAPAPESPAKPASDPVDAVKAAMPGSEIDELATKLDNAQSVNELNALYRAHKGEWKPNHSRIAANRKKVLNG